MKKQTGKKYSWAAAIASWYCLRLPSCGRGFESQHTIYTFSVCIIEIVMRKGQK